MVFSDMTIFLLSQQMRLTNFPLLAMADKRKKPAMFCRLESILNKRVFLLRPGSAAFQRRVGLGL
jgi:hypothetical protein